MLDHDVLVECLKYLNLKDVIRASQVSKKFNEAASHKDVWKELLIKYFSSKNKVINPEPLLLIDKSSSYKDAFKYFYIKDREIIDIKRQLEDVNSKLSDLDESESKLASTSSTENISLSTFVIPFPILGKDFGLGNYISSFFHNNKRKTILNEKENLLKSIKDNQSLYDKLLEPMLKK